MKLLICTEYFHPQTVSTGRVLFELAAALLSRHPELHIEVIRSNRDYRGLSGHETPIALPRLTVRHVPTLPLNRKSPLLRLLGDLWFSLGVLLRLLSLPKADVILVVTNPFVLPAVMSVLKRLRGIPYVYLIHDLYPDIAVSVGTVRETSAITRLFGKLQTLMLHQADAIVALGRCMKALVTARYHVPETKLHVITNWADPTDIAPTVSAAVKREVRQQYGLSEFVCLYSGNLGLFHDFDTLLGAARILKDSEPRISFLIAGEGGAKPYIEQRIQADKLTNVTLTSLVPHAALPALLASVDVAVVSLTKGAEGQAVPLKLYNLLAAGKPIIAITSPLAEVAQVITENDCGVQVAQGEVDKLVAALRRLLADPQTVSDMGHRARSALERHYTLAHIAPQYYTLFQTVANAS
jgi:glycosyltransferase involved in cell wall biosynthesis